MNRLYPKKNSGRYYILRVLRDNIQYIIDKYLKEAKDKTLLDFGCGNMPYKPLFKKYLKKYIGADIKKNILAEVEIKDSRLIIDDDFVDIVLSTQVLEHVEDINLYLSEANRVLKKDGLLILSTHGFWMYHPDPTDFWRWTKDGLSKIISENNFEIKEIVSTMNMAASGLQLFQDGIHYKVPKMLKKLFYRLIAMLQLIVDNRLKSAIDASVFIIIAKSIK